MFQSNQDIGRQVPDSRLQNKKPRRKKKHEPINNATLDAKRMALSTFQNGTLSLAPDFAFSQDAASSDLRGRLPPTDAKESVAPAVGRLGSSPAGLARHLSAVGYAASPCRWRG